MPGLILQEESFAILGACFAVYKHMGSGFLEAVYQECLQIELEERAIPFRPRVRLPLSYRGKTLSQFYIADFVCYDRIIIEIKAVSALADEHRAQILNYLAATGFELGMLVNFGHYPS